MEPREMIEDLVTKMAPNATVIGITEDHERYRVSVAGTSGVVADCLLPRDEVQAAGQWGDARRRVAAALKRCADDVVSPIGDGRA
jgi:hypothetical protein